MTTKEALQILIAEKEAALKDEFDMWRKKLSLKPGDRIAISAEVSMQTCSVTIRFKERVHRTRVLKGPVVVELLQKIGELPDFNVRQRAFVNELLESGNKPVTRSELNRRGLLSYVEQVNQILRRHNIAVGLRGLLDKSHWHQLICFRPIE